MNVGRGLGRGVGPEREVGARARLRSEAGGAPRRAVYGDVRASVELGAAGGAAGRSVRSAVVGAADGAAERAA